MLNKNQIIELIQTNRTPVWILRAKRYPHDMSLLAKGSFMFEGKGTGKATAADDEDGTGKLVTDAVLNESIKKLSATLELIKDEPVYSYIIEMKPANNSQPHRIGTYEFTIEGNEPGKHQNLSGIPTQYQQEQNMAGMGYVSKDYMEQRFELERQKYELEFNKRMFEADKERMRNEIAKKEEEIKAAKETAANNTKQLGNAFILGIGSIVDAITNGKFGAKEIAQQMAGIEQENEQITDIEGEETQQQKEAERLAEYVYNNIKDPEKIKAFVDLTISMVNKFNEKAEATQNPE